MAARRVTIGYTRAEAPARVDTGTGGRAMATDVTGMGAVDSEGDVVALAYDYRARASLGQLAPSVQQAIRDALRTLARNGWDLHAPAVLSVVTLRGPGGISYGIRLRAAPDVEVMLRPAPNDPWHMTVADVLNYEALRHVAASV